MLMLRNHTPLTLKVVASALLALALLASLLGFGAKAQGAALAGDGPGQIVFVAGKAERCKGEACNRFDVVRSISPHGRGGKVLALISSAAETASSESGTLAVLSRNVAGGGANSEVYTQVYLIGPNGKRRAVFPERLEGFNATGLGISADGRLLALSARSGEAESGRSKIWLVRADGTGMRQITDGLGEDEMPALSPDGKRVVFSRTLGANGRKPELYVARTDGSGEAVRLTENGVEDVNPVFGPDGRSIAFGQFNSARRRGAVAAVRVDGSGLRTVTSTGGEYPDPDYSPNGKNIAFVGELARGRGYESALFTVRASGAGRALASRAFDAPRLPQWTLRP